MPGWIWKPNSANPRQTDPPPPIAPVNHFSEFNRETSPWGDEALYSKNWIQNHSRYPGYRKFSRGYHQDTRRVTLGTTVSAMSFLVPFAIFCSWTNVACTLRFFFTTLAINVIMPYLLVCPDHQEPKPSPACEFCDSTPTLPSRFNTSPWIKFPLKIEERKLSHRGIFPSRGMVFLL